MLSQHSLPQVMSLQLRSRCQEMLSLVESLKKNSTRLTEFSGICLVQPRSHSTFHNKILDLCFETHLVCAFGVFIRAFFVFFFRMGNVAAHDSCINNHYYPIKEAITSPVAC